MDDEREIIYIALSNSLNGYYEMLEATQNNLSKEDLEILQYTIKRHIDIIDKLSSELALEEPEDTTIKRPNW